jgi:tetratricopeptide (TPR) repeat protein
VLLACGLSLGILSLESLRGQSALDEVRSILLGEPDAEALARASLLLDLAEQGPVPRGEVLLLRGDVLATMADLELVPDAPSRSSSGETRFEAEAISGQVTGKGAGCLEEATVLYEAGLRLDPFQARHHLYLAHVLARTGKTEEAREQSSQAVKAAPYHRDIVQRVAESRFYSWLETGDEAALLEAQDLVARLNALDPTLISDMLSVFELASADTAWLARVVPDTVAGHSEFALYLAGTGRYDEALLELDKAFALDPDRAELRVKGYLEVAGRLFEDGRLEEALAAVEKSREHEAEHSPRSNAKGDRLEALLLLALGRVEEAIPSLVGALHATRERDGLLHDAHTAIESSGTEQESIALWEELLEQFPFYGKPRYYLALTHLHLGHESEAIEILQDYARGQADVKALEVLARLTMKKSQWRLALQYVERARIYAPMDEKLVSLERDIRERLQ